jgi:hypothetical protein
MNIAERLTSSYRFYRFLEALPGLLSWSLILLPVVLAYVAPFAVAYFLLIYSVYWAFNSLKFVLYAYMGHRKLAWVLQHDWLKKLQEDLPTEWNKYYYCTLIPFASESIDIIRPTIQSLVDGNFPTDRKILCLSSEKAVPVGKNIAEELKEEFKDHFAYIFITEHELKEGEIKGKSANQNHAGRYFYDEALRLGLDPEYILITSNDADVSNHISYMPYLVHSFIGQGEDRFKRIYQPVTTDYLDIWNANFFSRIIVTIGMAWRLALNHRDDYRCVVVAFYTMSLRTLKEVNFWETDLIPEDERMMFNTMFTYGKDFRTVPLFIPTYGRPVQGKTTWEALVQQYVQIRRWAWGASEIANSVTKSLKFKHIPWQIKTKAIFNQIRTNVEWTSSSILLLFGGYFSVLTNAEFNNTFLANSLPNVLWRLVQATYIGLLFIIYLEWKIAPKRPKEKGILFSIFTLVQWIFLPYVGFLLGSIPALDAQTRLIFNKRIVYIESKKESKK